MPQMAPMWWSVLFIMFLTTYILTMIMTYFHIMYKNFNKMKQNKNKEKNMNWKW